LQGVSSEEEFDRLSQYLGTRGFYHPQDPVASYGEAARLFFLCRRAGITVRSATDCLIDRIAIEHELVLLHSDSDFDNVAGVMTELTLA
jgi:predicted nucleic acid-binding protein